MGVGILELLIILLILPVSLPFAIVILIAGLQMRRLQNYPLVLTGAVLAMLPMQVGWVLSMPLGLWALIVLLRPDVRRAFAANRNGAMDATAPPPKPRPPENVSVVGPAIGILVTGAINTLLFVGTALLFSLRLKGLQSEPGLSDVTYAVALPSILVLCGGLLGPAMILGGIAMLRRSSRPAASIGAVAAVIPCAPCFVFSVIFGIWALIRLPKWHPDSRPGGGGVAVALVTLGGMLAVLVLGIGVAAFTLVRSTPRPPSAPLVFLPDPHYDTAIEPSGMIRVVELRLNSTYVADALGRKFEADHREVTVQPTDGLDDTRRRIIRRLENIGAREIVFLPDARDDAAMVNAALAMKPDEHVLKYQRSEIRWVPLSKFAVVRSLAANRATDFGTESLVILPTQPIQGSMIQAHLAGEPPSRLVLELNPTGRQRLARSLADAPARSPAILLDGVLYPLRRAAVGQHGLGDWVMEENWSDDEREDWVAILNTAELPVPLVPISP